MISQVCKSSNVITLYLNVSGFVHKLADIMHDNTLRFADVMCFNETQFCLHQKVALKNLGYDDTYEIFRKDRNEHGGGVMIVVWKCLNP